MVDATDDERNTVVFRPSRSRLTSHMLAASPVAFTLLVVAGARLVSEPGRRSGPLWFGAIVLLVFLPALLAGFLYAVNARVKVRRDDLEWRGILRRRRLVRRSEIGRAVLQPLTSAGRRAIRLILVDRHGRRILCMDGHFWEAANIEETLRALDLTARVTRVRSASQLRRLFPHAAPWWQLHPWFALSAVPPVALALVFAAVRLLDLPI